MTRKHPAIVILCMIGNLMAIACSEPLQAEEAMDFASCDYLQAYRLAYVPARAKITDQRVYFTVASHLKGVAPGKISLTIKAETGPIPVAVNINGSFSLPFSEEMIARNPKIVSNQPKETLSLECIMCEMSVPLGESATMTYRELMEPLMMLNAIEAVIDGERKLSHPANVSFLLDEKGPSPAKIILQSMTKKSEIEVDKFGMFEMPFSG